MLYDVAVIGAGPCGLAVAARLRETTPAALFTDDEHARYWKRFNRSESIEAERKSARRGHDRTVSGSTSQYKRSLVVLDANAGEWMSAWRARFRHLQIDHLRSPLFFHPDPRDRDGLLAFSHFTGRSDELEEIHHVVGKEISKHRAKKQRQKYVYVLFIIKLALLTKQEKLFEDYCDDIVSRYQLQDLVHHAQVTEITYGDIGDLSGRDIFSLSTSKGLYMARTVVLAVGPGAKPCIPRDCGLLGAQEGSVCHCFDANGGTHIPNHVKQRILAGLPTNVVVVGGGLTSAQISDLLLRYGVSKVWLLLRGKYKLKHFDVDLEWVSKVRNQQMAVFWSADTDEERFGLLRQARNGGSITPKYDKILQQHVLRNRLEILPFTQIDNGAWDTSSQTWSIRLSKNVPQFPKHIDHITYATGVAPRLENVPCLKQFIEEYPVESIDGLARITNDLMWNTEVPLFLTGGLAGLRLGPGAANLVGARQGAERIAWKIDEFLGTVPSTEEMRRKCGCEDGFEGLNASNEGEVQARDQRLTLLENRSEFTGGFQNQFEALALDHE